MRQKNQDGKRWNEGSEWMSEWRNENAVRLQYASMFFLEERKNWEGWKQQNHLSNSCKLQCDTEQFDKESHEKDPNLPFQSFESSSGMILAWRLFPVVLDSNEFMNTMKDWLCNTHNACPAVMSLNPIPLPMGLCLQITIRDFWQITINVYVMYALHVNIYIRLLARFIHSEKTVADFSVWLAQIHTKSYQHQQA